MQTETGAANVALQRLGEPAISSFDTDGSATGRRIRLAFPVTRRNELRKHTWNFSVKRIVLAPDAEAPAFDYTYQFTLPADFLRLVADPDPDADWVFEGGKILSNDSNVLYLRYVADIEAPGSWDSAFYNAFICALAADLSEIFTSSPGKHQMMVQDYEMAIKQARKANAFEKRPTEIPDQSFLRVRY